MTSGLRRAHKYIWLLIAIVLPVLVIFSFDDIQLTTPKTIGTNTASTDVPKVIKSSENELLKAVLLEDNSLRVILKSSLAQASSIIYLLDANNNLSKPIGQLNSRGSYLFELHDKNIYGIAIKDNIKDQLVTKLEF